MISFFNTVKANKSLIFALLLSIILVFFVGFIVFIFVGDGYLPTHEDETIFYNITRLFCETGSVKGESCIEENFSIIFEANWYGIAYNIFYGGIAKIIGLSNFLFVSENIILIFISLIIISNITTSRVNKIIMMLCFMMFNMVFTYTFTFFPETLNIFFGICLTFLLIKIHEKNLLGERKKFIYLFVLLTFIFSFFRVTWIFWLIGLLPFARNRNDVIRYSLVFLAGVAIAFFYIQFFCAPYFVVGGSIMNELKQFHFFEFVKGCLVNIVRNVYYFFIWRFKVPWYWMFIKIFYVFIVVHLVIRIFKRTNILMFSVALIFLINMLVLFTLYTSNFPYIMKLSSSIFILFFIVVIYLEEKHISQFILIILAVSFPFTVMNSYLTIRERKKLFDRSMTVNKEQVAVIKEIADMVNRDKESIIQYVYYDIENIPRNIFLTAVPMSNGRGFPIRYTCNLYKKGIPYEENFRTFNRIKIDCVLSNHELHKEGLTLLQKNDFFYFYKNSN